MNPDIPLWRRFLPALVLALALAAALFLFTRVLGVRADGEALSLAEQNIRRAAVECYALEGFYPASLSYLREHYGVTVDEGRYLVDYTYIGSNLMPDITVLPLPG